MLTRFSIIAALSMLLLATVSYGSDATYEELTKMVVSTMGNNLSAARQESYGPIKFDKCTFEYTVSGVYPSGGLYTIRFSDMDIASLNPGNSKAGYDYTSFVILNFDKEFSYKSAIDDIKVRTTVINTADDAAAQTLFAAFSRLGKLCGAR